MDRPTREVHNSWNKLSYIWLEKDPHASVAVAIMYHLRLIFKVGVEVEQMA